MISALLVGQLVWNIPLLIFFTFVTIVYFIVMKLSSATIQSIHSILFLLGIWLLYFVIGSPLLAISYLSFIFHMIQMSFLYFIIPPLILLGIPQALYSYVTKLILPKRSPVRFPPKIALISFSVLFLMYHLPFILTIISEYPIIQKGFLFILFLFAFRMWWPIAAPNVSERVFLAKRKKFVLESSLYIMPACLIFIVSALLDGTGNPLLSQITVHLCLPQDSMVNILPAPFHTKYDQIFAGVCMLGLHKAGLMMTCKLEEKC